MSLTGLACKGLSVPGRRHSGVGLHVEQSGDVGVLAVKGLRVPGRGVVELACKGAVCPWPACFTVSGVVEGALAVKRLRVPGLERCTGRQETVCPWPW